MNTAGLIEPGALTGVLPPAVQRLPAAPTSVLRRARVLFRRLACFAYDLLTGPP